MTHGPILVQEPGVWDPLCRAYNGGNVKYYVNVVSDFYTGVKLHFFVCDLEGVTGYRSHFYDSMWILRHHVCHVLLNLSPSQDTVSVHRPGFYAERFQQFMCNTVFKKIPCECVHFDSSRILILTYDRGAKVFLLFPLFLQWNHHRLRRVEEEEEEEG